MFADVFRCCWIWIWIACYYSGSLLVVFCFFLLILFRFISFRFPFVFLLFHRIAPWELRRVGIIGASTVPAVETVLTRATLNGTVYFEADPATQASDEYFAVELYTIPGAYDASSSEEAEEATASSDCAAQGVRLATGLYTSVLTVTPLASDDYNTVYPADTSAECFPQTTTGAVYQFDFSITDPYVSLCCVYLSFRVFS